MRQMLFVLTMIVFAVGLAGCGGNTNTPTPPPPNQTGSIVGVVSVNAASHALLVSRSRAATGTPIAGATISVRGYPTLTAQSSATGAFQIDKVPVGPQVLDISCPGFTRTTCPITVQTGVNQAPSVGPGAAAHWKWTVLVYMAANNTLASEAELNLHQIEQAAAAPGATNAPVMILVQKTVPAATGSKTTRYAIQPNTPSPAETITDLGSTVDSGNPQSLQQFIAWGQSYAPAEHYLVDIWDHGSGWDPINDAPTTAASLHRAICIDDTTGSVMTDASLSAALSSQYPIDIVTMDACLMSCAEVAYQIRGQADYLVCSEDATPAAGFNYIDLIAKLIAQPTIAPNVYAQYIATDSLQYWGNDPGLTMSALDLSKMDAVASALNTFSQRLIALESANASALYAGWQQCTAFDGSNGYDMRDLTVYAKAVAAKVSDSQLKAAATQLTQAIANSVVWCGKGSQETQANGLSIYLPSGVTFSTNQTASSSYAMLELAKRTAWEQWLKVSPGLR